MHHQHAQGRARDGDERGPPTQLDGGTTRGERERERERVCARLSMNPRATRVVEKLNASKLSGAPSIFWEKIGSLIKAEAAIFCASIDKKGFSLSPKKETRFSLLSFSLSLSVLTRI